MYTLVSAANTSRWDQRSAHRDRPRADLAWAQSRQRHPRSRQVVTGPPGIRKVAQVLGIRLEAS